MESSTSPAEIFTKGISFKIKNKVMVKCFGQTVAFTKDNGKMAYKMGKDKYT